MLDSCNHLTSQSVLVREASDLEAVLALLCCHPDWERRGAGTALTQWGVDKAKEMGLPAYVEASVPGQPVYERVGFKPIDAVVMRAEDIDREKDQVYVTLIHQGGQKSEST